MSELEQNLENRRRIAARWAGFSDAELDELERVLYYASRPYWREVVAELERREALQRAG